MWPPLLFSGIQITELSDDFRRCRARLRDWPGTRNIHGTQFGGSLFAMTDPIYSIMLHGLLGKRYFIWDKAAHIEFVRPGRGAVYLDCSLDDDILQEIRRHTEGGEKYFPEFTIRVYDDSGETIAIAKRVLYVRLKPSFRPRATDER